jgi:hypothetical protein
MASALRFLRFPFKPVELPGYSATQGKRDAAVQNAAVITRYRLPPPNRSHQWEVTLIVALVELVQQLRAELVQQQNTAQKAKKTKSPRKPPTPETAIHYWTFSEVLATKPWSESKIHRLFDDDPDCLRDGNPEYHFNDKGEWVRGYVNLIGIPDSSIAREEARQQGVMKKNPEKVKKPGKGIKLA